MRHDKVKALATIICTADHQATEANIDQHCFVDVSLQHPSHYGKRRSKGGALLSWGCVDKLTNCDKNCD